MEQEKIQELIMKYNEGQADPSEIKMIERLIEDGTIDLSQFHELKTMEEHVMRIESPIPSTELDDSFYQMLRGMKKEGNHVSSVSRHARRCTGHADGQPVGTSASRRHGGQLQTWFRG